jgi:hypothetical protein
MRAAFHARHATGRFRLEAAPRHCLSLLARRGMCAAAKGQPPSDSASQDGTSTPNEIAEELLKNERGEVRATLLSFSPHLSLSPSHSSSPCHSNSHPSPHSLSTLMRARARQAPCDPRRLLAPIPRLAISW